MDIVKLIKLEIVNYSYLKIDLLFYKISSCQTKIKENLFII